MDEVLGSEVGGRYTLTGLLRCRKCQEPVAVGGSAYISEPEPLGYSFERGAEYGSRTTEYTIRFVNPAPPLVKVPTECPVSVGELIKSAFALYFLDPEAAVNRLRTAVEVLLTELGILEPHNGRPSLHARIGKLKGMSVPAERQLADRLEAVKWLGNAASHASTLKEEDALDAFELLESVLHDRFVPEGRTAKGIAQSVNKKKGPRS